MFCEAQAHLISIEGSQCLQESPVLRSEKTSGTKIETMEEVGEDTASRVHTIDSGGRGELNIVFLRMDVLSFPKVGMCL